MNLSLQQVMYNTGALISSLQPFGNICCCEGTAIWTLHPEKHPRHPCLAKHPLAPGPWAWHLWQHQRWKRDTCHLGPRLSQGPSRPAARAPTASENKLALKAAKDSRGSAWAHKPLRATRPASAPLHSPTARQHSPLPRSAPARRSGSPTRHCSWCIEVQAVWPSQPLAIRNLGWIHQQFSFVAVWFSYSMFLHQGWLKSTESLPSKWVGSDCQGWGLLASDLLHSCYFCGESGNRVSCTSQTAALLAVSSGLF